MAVKMRFVISVAVLVMSAMASPQMPEEHPYGDVTVAQAQESCGDHQTLACCNTNSGDGNNGGALSECAKLDIALRKNFCEMRCTRNSLTQGKQSLVYRIFWMTTAMDKLLAARTYVTLQGSDGI